MAYLDYNGLAYFKQKNDALYAKATDLSNLSDVVAQKANIDGSYELLTSGNAEQLVSSVGIEDQTPYNFRTSGGSTEIGDREELNAVVGATVAWNQLVQNGNFSSNTNWSWRLSGGGSIENNEGKLIAVNTSANNQMFQNITLPANRKFLVTFSARKGADNSFSWLKVSLASSNVLNVTKEVTLGTSKADYAVIMTHTASSGNLRFSLSATSLSVGDTAYISNVNLFDLTLTLGSTIADYIYSLEQANAGAGVAWFRKYFPKLFYGYSAPTMLSVKTSAHKMVGFNQWDEEWELGYYNVDTGVSSASNSQIRCKNKIKVVPNTTYYIKAPNTLWILEYDADDIYLNKYTSKMNQVFTTSANTQYIRFYTLSSYGTTYKHDICINLHWDGERDGEYEPYEAHTYALDDVELRGILKLDANNNLHADGDRYLPDGTVERRYTEHSVVANNLTNNGGDDVNSVYRAFYHCPDRAYTTNVVCDRFTQGSAETPFAIGVRTNGDGIEFRIPYSAIGVSSSDTDNAKLTAAKAWFTNNVTKLVYELETPTTESADPYQQAQIVDDFGTEEFVDAAVEANERDVAIPVGNETVYKPNLRAKLEMAPDSPDGDGDYIVRQTNGQNTYIPLVEVKELPDMPSEDGNYTLRCTVTNGTATLSWVSA